MNLYLEALVLAVLALSVSADYSSSQQAVMVIPAGYSKAHHWVGFGEYAPNYVPMPFTAPRWIPHYDPSYTASWVPYPPKVRRMSNYNEHPRRSSGLISMIQNRMGEFDDSAYDSMGMDSYDMGMMDSYGMMDTYGGEVEDSESLKMKSTEGSMGMMEYEGGGSYGSMGGGGGGSTHIGGNWVPYAPAPGIMKGGGGGGGYGGGGGMSMGHMFGGGMSMMGGGGYGGGMMSGGGGGMMSGGYGGGGGGMGFMDMMSMLNSKNGQPLLPMKMGGGGGGGMMMGYGGGGGGMGGGMSMFGPAKDADSIGYGGMMSMSDHSGSSGSGMSGFSGSMMQGYSSSPSMSSMHMMPMSHDMMLAMAMHGSKSHEEEVLFESDHMPSSMNSIHSGGMMGGGGWRRR